MSAVASWVLAGLPGAAHAAAPPGFGQPADLVDYGLIVGGLLMIGGAHLFDGPRPAALGPVYDPAAPAGIFDPAQRVRIDRPYLDEGAGELVPTRSATIGVGLVFAAVAADALAGHLAGGLSARHSHDTIVGFAEGASLTLGVVELLKPIVGRLRPDFRDRARRYHCQAGDITALDCAGVAKLANDAAAARRLLDDGRKSFPSGHSAASFFAATYAASVLGGRYVWGDGAGPTSRALGLLGGGLLLGAAGFIATSRVDDGRHNLTDVAAGAAIGTTFAAFSYWRRFDARGRALRETKASGAVSGGALTAREPAPVLAVGGRF